MTLDICKKNILLHVFFLSCKQICFLILSYVRYNYYHIYYSFFFNIVFLHFVQQKGKYDFTFIFNIFCSNCKLH